MLATNNIALLYFSRNAQVEGRTKAWHTSSGGNINRRLASTLITISSRFLDDSGLPVFHYHEGNQRGRNFGERFANAYQEIFALGYTGVIAIGNDAPEIVKIDLQAVCRDLLSGKSVLGASCRGGAYLIGISAATFHKERFQNLPWQTNKIFTALRQFCDQADAPPSILETLRDINSLHDLRLILRNTRLKEIYKSFILFLETTIRKIYRFAHRSESDSHILNDSPLRAPPRAVSFAVR